MAVPDIVRPSRDELDGHYKAGSIKRVKLKDFLTYDAVEFYPGPRLNVVVGPNGTGKSTILCAICLGLGGQPPLLGRADDARLFIKHEKDRAEIEIELAPLPKPTGGGYEAIHVIRRVIDRDRGKEGGRGAGASTYYINGHKSSLKNVKELVTERYRIHIDNLCTFLPQDKVGNFSGFDKQALLAETEKSLSGHLYNTHQDLIELERALRTSGTDVASIEAELHKLRRENERLEREKELMEERRECLERIDLLGKKRAWLLFDARREEAKVAKERREALKKRKKEAERAIRPLAERHAKAEGEHSRIQSRYRAIETKMKKDKKSYDDCFAKSDRYEDEMQNELSEYQTIDAQQRRAEKNVERERGRLREVEAQGEDFPTDDDIERRLRESKREMTMIKGRINGEKSRMSGSVDEIEKAEQDRKEAADRLDRLKDDKSLRLQMICGRIRTVGEAYKFIDQNRKMFRRKVWGPIAAEVEPKDQGTAACLENHVSQATWKAFVVECKEDYDLLFREVREKRKTAVNIILVQNGKLEARKRMYSEERMDILQREHGFYGYLDETFTAPDAIMEALLNRHNVDKVLVGGDAVQNSLERKDLIEFLSTRENGDRRPGKQASCFFYTHRGSSYKYTNQPSRYTGLIGTSQDDISKAKMLKPGSDPAVKEQLAETVRRAEEIVAELRPEVEAAQTRIKEMTAEGQAVSMQFKDAQRTKREFANYKMKLKNQRDKLEEAEEAAAKDNDKEKSRRVAKIKKLIENLTAMSENAAELHNQMLKGTAMLTGVKMSEDGLSVQMRKLADKLEEKKAETQEIANQYADADLDYNLKKKNAKELLNKAEDMAPKEQWHARLEEPDLPENLEGVEESLDEAESKADSITDNPHVMKQYEERKRDIEALQVQLDDAGGEKDMKRKQLEQKLSRWESALINIVNKVSLKFSSYMKEVGCAGEIRLYTAGANEEPANGDDLNYNFKDWGVEILVKFREASTLQVLSAQTHSGGERSVSTIMYLMGLQNLMASPFRCVDEINQGLDERNERLVFKRIVENSTAPAGTSSNSDHCGQYFLITPKLLPNLDGMENENIAVLFVFSGAHNFAKYSDWNVDKFIEDKKRFMIQQDDGEHESTNVSSSGRGKKRRSKQ